MTKKLTKAQYWEWRCTIEEMKTAELNKGREILSIKLMEKDLELQQLKLMNQKRNLGKVTNAVVDAKKEYERFKEMLEEKLKISLKDKSIDPVTFEIHDLG